MACPADRLVCRKTCMFSRRRPPPGYDRACLFRLEKAKALPWDGLVAEVDSQATEFLFDLSDAKSFALGQTAAYLLKVMKSRKNDLKPAISALNSKCKRCSSLGP